MSWYSITGFSLNHLNLLNLTVGLESSFRDTETKWDKEVGLVGAFHCTDL